MSTEEDSIPKTVATAKPTIFGDGDNEELRDVSVLASWSASSSRSGCDIENLRDENPDTFWQSDGQQPHHINIHFFKRVAMKTLKILLMYRTDESYCPNKLRISAGFSELDLQHITTVHTEEPDGWITVPIGEWGKNGLLRLHYLRITILGNHQNGKDSHIRCIRIFAPPQPEELQSSEELEFTHPLFLRHLTVR